MIESIAISDFFRKNDSKGFNQYLAPNSRINIDLVEWVKACTMISGDVLPGYRDGVVLVRTRNLGWTVHDTVDLREDDRFVGAYERRMPGEEPRKGFQVVRPQLPLAKYVFFVLYRADVLAEGGEQSTDAEWEIIAALTSSLETPEPMHPDPLIANHFVLSGGTTTGMSAEQFETALRESVNFWKSRAKAVYPC